MPQTPHCRVFRNSFSEFTVIGFSVPPSLTGITRILSLPGSLLLPTAWAFTRVSQPLKSRGRERRSPLRKSPDQMPSGQGRHTRVSAPRQPSRSLVRCSSPRGVVLSHRPSLGNGARPLDYMQGSCLVMSRGSEWQGRSRSSHNRNRNQAMKRVSAYGIWPGSHHGRS